MALKVPKYRHKIKKVIRGGQEVAIRRFGKSEDFPEFVAKTKMT
jgi:hypothetical protein